MTTFTASNGRRIERVENQRAGRINDGARPLSLEQELPQRDHVRLLELAFEPRLPVRLEPDLPRFSIASRPVA
jgi:hypothetical protein